MKYEVLWVFRSTKGVFINRPEKFFKKVRRFNETMKEACKKKIICKNVQKKNLCETEHEIKCINVH